MIELPYNIGKVFSVLYSQGDFPYNIGKVLGILPSVFTAQLGPNEMLRCGQLVDHVYRHVCRDVYRDVCRHVYRDVYRNVHLDE